METLATACFNPNAYAFHFLKQLINPVAMQSHHIFNQHIQDFYIVPKLKKKKTAEFFGTHLKSRNNLEIGCSINFKKGAKPFDVYL